MRMNALVISGTHSRPPVCMSEFVRLLCAPILIVGPLAACTNAKAVPIPITVRTQTMTRARGASEGRSSSDAKDNAREITCYLRHPRCPPKCAPLTMLYQSPADWRTPVPHPCAVRKSSRPCENSMGSSVQLCGELIFAISSALRGHRPRNGAALIVSRSFRTVCKQTVRKGGVSGFHRGVGHVRIAHDSHRGIRT